MSPAGFETEIPASKQPPHALDRAATGIGAEISKGAKYGRHSYFWLITIFIYMLITFIIRLMHSIIQNLEVKIYVV